MSRRRRLAALAACAWLPGLAAAPSAALEAAAIYPSHADFAHGGFPPGGRLELRGFTLLDLIVMAYDVDRQAVAGGPNWLDDDRFDVSAKTSARAPGARLEM